MEVIQDSAVDTRGSCRMHDACGALCSTERDAWIPAEWRADWSAPKPPSTRLDVKDVRGHETVEIL